MCMHVSLCAYRGQKAIVGAGVTVGCELSEVGAWNWTQVLRKKQQMLYALKHLSSPIQTALKRTVFEMFEPLGFLSVVWPLELAPVFLAHILTNLRVRESICKQGFLERSLSPFSPLSPSHSLSRSYVILYVFSFSRKLELTSLGKWSLGVLWPQDGCAGRKACNETECGHRSPALECAEWRWCASISAVINPWLGLALYLNTAESCICTTARDVKNCRQISLSLASEDRLVGKV